MHLTCSAFKNKDEIPSKYTCDGSNINPELFISQVPSQAQSLVLIMDDPDVPPSVRADKMWNHWVVFNIPPQTSHIAENSMPPGVAGRNTEGELTYQGPCPPDREHRYFFKLYALDILLSLSQGASKKEVEAAMRGHILAEAELMGRYERK